MKESKMIEELLERVAERFEDTMNQMSLEELNTMPEPLIKSVTWLVWHTAREIDLQISELAEQSPLWDKWTEKFQLPLPDDTEDFRHTPEEAATVTVKDRQLLLDYLHESIALTNHYVQSLNEEKLEEIIDERWTPPVTRRARIISVVDDALMHSGQAVYTRRLVIKK